MSFWTEHWSGHGWQVVRLPASLVGFQKAVLTVAASRQDVWLFNPSVRREALYWNGSGWRARAIPSWVIRGNLGLSVDLATADFGPDDLWVFSLGVTGLKPVTPFAAHFNGSRWSKVPLPAFPFSVSAVSGKDIWALGPPGAGGASVLMHWTGSAWHKLGVPKVKVPANSVEFVAAVTAAGPRDVWLKRDIETGSQGAHTLYLLHWNGKGWRRVAFGFPTSFADYLAQDGHGGLWVAANGPAPGFQWFFDHFGGGRWSRQPVPASAGTTLQQVRELISIPGTRSMWATGGLLPLNSTTDVLGGIWKFGS